MEKSGFTEEQIVRILNKASSGVKTQTQLCKEHENTNQDFILEGHEYWAGTSKNNYTQPYSGLFVGQYRIVVRYNPQKDPERYPRHEKTANGTGMKGGEKLNFKSQTCDEVINSSIMRHDATVANV